MTVNIFNQYILNSINKAFDSMISYDIHTIKKSNLN